MAASAVEPKLAGVYRRVLMAILASPRPVRKNLIGVAILAQQPGVLAIQHVILIVVEGRHPIPAVVAAEAVDANQFYMIRCLVVVGPGMAGEAVKRLLDETILAVTTMTGHLRAVEILAVVLQAEAG